MVLEDFYSVIKSERKEGIFITDIRINKDHQIFEGHFPNRPVTPGVILMHLFKEEAERQQNCRLEFHSATNVKFMTVVNPNLDEILRMESKIEKEGDFIRLKGIAKQKHNTSLKISSLYRVM